MPAHRQQDFRPPGGAQPPAGLQKELRATRGRGWRKRRPQLPSPSRRSREPGRRAPAISDIPARPSGRWADEADPWRPPQRHLTLVLRAFLTTSCLIPTHSQTHKHASLPLCWSSWERAVLVWTIWSCHLSKSKPWNSNNFLWLTEWC